MKRYSVYNDGLYDSYISILKDYKDTEYVLSKLQFLRNSGKDIKADYIEVVDKLCKQAKLPITISKNSLLEHMTCLKIIRYTINIYRQVFLLSKR